MKILLLGKNGQVGWELQRALAPLGAMVALDRAGADGLRGDLEDLDGLARTVRKLAPDVIVNAAAYTAVDKAETDVARAQCINAEAPGVLAAAAAEVGALLVHYSTDYIFDGSKPEAYVEDDLTNPLSVYGKTKLEGEEKIRAALCRHLIFRTSWVYSARGANFAKTMLRFGKERSEMSVINDQFGAPTGAELLADCTAHAIRVAQCKPEVAGLYHLIASGTTTWFDYAQLVFAKAREAGVELAVMQLNAVPTSAFPTPAKRPHNSRLDTGKFQRTFDLVLPDWTVGVERMLTEILGK